MPGRSRQLSTRKNYSVRLSWFSAIVSASELVRLRTAFLPQQVTGLLAEGRVLSRWGHRPRGDPPWLATSSSRPGPVQIYTATCNSNSQTMTIPRSSLIAANRSDGGDRRRRHPTVGAGIAGAGEGKIVSILMDSLSYGNSPRGPASVCIGGHPGGNPASRKDPSESDNPPVQARSFNPSRQRRPSRSGVSRRWKGSPVRSPSCCWNVGSSWPGPRRRNANVSGLNMR